MIALLALVLGGGPETPPLEEVLREATAWLVENQRPDGAWGSHQSPRPIEVLCDVPGSHDAFRVATTGLVVSALLHGPVQDAEVEASLSRGVDALLEQWNVKRANGMEHYTVWALGYGLQGLADFLLLRPEDPRRGRAEEVCRALVRKLERYQCLDGGWGYLSLGEVPTWPPSSTSMSFTTGVILVALDRARAAGIEAPAEMIERAVASVRRCRTPSGSYTYGELWNRRPASGLNQRKGAACRTPCCNLAVELFGTPVPGEDHVRSLEDLLVRHARFQIVALRRPIPHESHYAVSGYFYLFGMEYASRVWERMPEAVRERYRDPLVDMVLRTRQPDGSFWDYPLYSYHKPYGTAYALLALGRVYRKGSGEGSPVGLRQGRPSR